MGILRELFGLIFLLLSFFNPFSFLAYFQSTFILIASESFSMIPQTALFIFFIIFQPFNEMLMASFIFLLVIEAILLVLKNSKIGLIVRPLAIASAVLILNSDFILAVSAGAIDLLLHLADRITLIRKPRSPKQVGHQNN